LIPLARRPRATIAAIAIISLSRSRAVRFKVFLRGRCHSARPHLRKPKRALCWRPIEFREDFPQTHLQLSRTPRGEARNDEPGHHGCDAVTLQLGSELTHQLDSRLRIGAEIDQRPDGFEVTEQGPTSSPCEHVVSHTEAIRPDKTTVYLDLP